MSMGQNQFSVVVVDDQSQSSDMPGLIAEYSFLNLLGEFKELSKALEFVKDISPDVVILDVKMPTHIGLDWLESTPNSPELIIVGSHGENAPMVLSGNLVFYILKPVTKEKFLQALKNTVQAINKKRWQKKESRKLKKPEGNIFIKSEDTFLGLAFEEIDYVYASGGGVKIYYNGEFFLAESTLKIFENELPATLFCRVHKSYIVRLDRIIGFNASRIQMQDVSIPLGKEYRERFENSIIKIP